MRAGGGSGPEREGVCTRAPRRRRRVSLPRACKDSPSRWDGVVVYSASALARCASISFQMSSRWAAMAAMPPALAAWIAWAAGNGIVGRLAISTAA